MIERKVRLGRREVPSVVADRYAKSIYAKMGIDMKVCTGGGSRVFPACLGYFIGRDYEGMTFWRGEANVRENPSRCSSSVLVEIAFNDEVPGELKVKVDEEGIREKGITLEDVYDVLGVN